MSSPAPGWPGRPPPALTAVPAADPTAGLDEGEALLLALETAGDLVVLEGVRAGGVTHLVPLHGEAALCGRLLDGGWAAGHTITCPACAAHLAPEAD